MSAVSLVTIHHEGAGDPSDVARGAHGGYSYWLGRTGWTRLRSPQESFATFHFNHVSVDVCLSGNREAWDVTGDDLVHLGEIAADTRSRGELVRVPEVRPHRWSPGSSTVCPGGKAMAKWDQIKAKFILVPAPAPKPVPAPASAPKPVPTPPWHPTLVPGQWGPWVQRLQHELNVGAGQHLKEDGVFGWITASAVYGIQSFFHLDVDGIVGPKTWGVVDFCYAARGGK